MHSSVSASGIQTGAVLPTPSVEEPLTLLVDDTNETSVDDDDDDDDDNDDDDDDDDVIDAFGCGCFDARST